MHPFSLPARKNVFRSGAPYLMMFAVSALTLLLMVLLGDAFAQTTPVNLPPPVPTNVGDVSDIFNAPALDICHILVAARESLLISAIAIGCVFIGMALFITKNKGAVEWTGVVGFILIKQSFNIARNFGIVTNGCI